MAHRHVWCGLNNVYPIDILNPDKHLKVLRFCLVPSVFVVDVAVALNSLDLSRPSQGYGIWDGGGEDSGHERNGCRPAETTLAVRDSLPVGRT